MFSGTSFIDGNPPNPPVLSTYTQHQLLVLLDYSNPQVYGWSSNAWELASHNIVPRFMWVIYPTWIGKVCHYSTKHIISWSHDGYHMAKDIENNVKTITFVLTLLSNIHWYLKNFLVFYFLCNEKTQYAMMSTPSKFLFEPFPLPFTPSSGPPQYSSKTNYRVSNRICFLCSCRIIVLFSL